MPMSKQEMKQMKNDPEYKPQGDELVMETSSIHTRNSRSKQLEDEGIEEDCKVFVNFLISQINQNQV